ncbi:MAG: hypothetical protein J6A52_06105 [Bacilli bacterium]|nr:hypothetical protein [Bacilli bacterium]
METLNQYFSYNHDYSELSSIFSSLYSNLRVIHENGMYVPRISADNIIYDGKFSFDSMSLSYNTELNKRENLVSLTKLFLGAYLSLSTGFRDFSSVNIEWFADNMEGIKSVITDDDFSSHFFSSVLFEGENIYYDEFLRKQAQSSDLNSRSSKKGYAKVLSNAGSKFYEDQTEEIEENPFDRKTAYINFLFYPVLAFCSLLVIFVFYSCIKFWLN